MDQLFNAVKKDVFTLLKFNNFTIAGGKALLAFEEISIQVELEKSRFNTSFHQSFWINFHLILNPNQTSASQTAKPGILYFFTNRISLLWKQPFAVYEFKPGDHIDHLLLKIRNDISEYFLPLTTYLSTIQEAERFIDQFDQPDGSNPYALPFARALAETDRIALSTKYFKKSVGVPEIIKDMASNYGITLD